MGGFRVIAKAGDSVKERRFNAPVPKIMKVKILSDLDTAINKAKYGQKIIIDIETRDAVNCTVVVRAKCVDWINDQDLSDETKFNILTYTAPQREGVRIIFTPKAEWLRDQNEFSNKTEFEITLSLLSTITWNNNSTTMGLLDKLEHPGIDIDRSGFYYTYKGEYLGRVGLTDDVLVCTESVMGDNLFKDAVPLMIMDEYIQNEVFLRIAGLASAETGLDFEAVKRVPYAIANKHLQYLHSKMSKYTFGIWNLEKTIQRARIYSDQEYADINPMFRRFVGNADKNQIVNLNSEMNAFKRNADTEYGDLFKLAFEYTIKSIQYINKYYNSPPLDGLIERTDDLSLGSMGWHGFDLMLEKYEIFATNLHIRDSEKKYGFEKWTNKSTLENSIWVSTVIYKKRGVTLFYKSTSFGFKKNPTGM